MAGRINDAEPHPPGLCARPMPTPRRSLLEKVWKAHTVRELPSGQTQIFLGLHLIHEVASPQAFAMLRQLELPVRFPSETLAMVYHIIPTDSQQRPWQHAAQRGVAVAVAVRRPKSRVDHLLDLAFPLPTHLGERGAPKQPVAATRTMPAATADCMGAIPWATGPGVVG